ncbi:splicing factor 3B subunit, putative [Entamoeba dispar SAW760]|uniref:Splicing factor 3B subunit, putative n=1 Tax=Entamoeba dispar (strain ATCC PRA-260 / SAW760) TaxID=370354 RepID=B0ETJ3_ENTDS|nr:splicing factor 3B subunit, putative [Entamoeba dispar SAW760]EDR22178.1 splicing factor 3B subunit, putative [Entamoeba dispar SAW760]|eukprot:EDR22178.1 splicing factor 3B subunit, putative [Entamoeba dispar SAW760]
MGSYGGMPNIKNFEAIVYCSDLDEKVDEQLLYELMIQAGPVVNVSIPRDRISNQHKGIGYVEFQHDYDADYAVKVFGDNIKLYGKQVKFSRNVQLKKSVDIGANLFVSGIDDSVSETTLSDAFRNFGNIISSVKIEKNEKTGKNFAFISYDNFDASDKAIANMNGQMMGGKQISVEYAFKNKKGERYGDASERLLARGK